MQKPTLKTTWMPLGFAIIALIILNAGLYLRLGAQPATKDMAQNLTIPYAQSFAEIDLSTMYSTFGGDWEIRDESLVQLSTTGYDLGGFIPLQIPADQPYQYETRLRFLGGSMGGGILFNAQSTNTRQQSHMARLNVDAGQVWLIYGYFGDNSDFTGQGSALVPFAPDNADWHTVGVHVLGDTYRLLVDGQVVAENIPLAYFGGAVGLIASTSQIAFDDVRADILADTTRAQATAEVTQSVVNATPPPMPTPFDDGVVLWGDAFDPDGVGDNLWLPLTGDWQFTEAGLRQTIRDGYDFIIVNSQPVTTPYRFIVQFRHDEGIGGGVVFNLPQTTNRNGGTMVRYIEENTLTWGYFDEAGAYIGVGSAPVAPPATDNHQLEVIVTDTAYALILDGVQIAEGIPITRVDGYIGLTNSQSIVTFTRVQVVVPQPDMPAEATATPETGSTALDLNTISGQWETSGYTTVQTASDTVDYIAGMGVFAEAFRVSVDITLPTDITDAGGGLIFHMNGRDNPALGSMVRFANGGSEIFWGVYDENGVFTGQGGAPLDLEAGVLHTLTVIVRRGSYDILVDAVTVIQNVPLTRGDGWIGLISFRGPVTFANLRLSIGETAP